MYQKTTPILVSAYENVQGQFEKADAQAQFPGATLLSLTVLTDDPRGNNPYWSQYLSLAPGLNSSERTELVGYVDAAIANYMPTVEGYDSGKPGSATVVLFDTDHKFAMQIPLLEGGTYGADIPFADSGLNSTDQDRVAELMGKLRIALLAAAGFTDQ